MGGSESNFKIQENLENRPHDYILVILQVNEFGEKIYWFARLPTAIGKHIKGMYIYCKEIYYR